MKKYAMILYPDFSLQEVTTLTSVLTVWFGEKIDFIASENKEYFSEEGLCVKPTKTVDEAKITGIGMFFREFAEAVLKRFDYDFGRELMRERPEDFSEEELTFYWSDEDYKEFQEELKEYMEICIS